MEAKRRSVFLYFGDKNVSRISVIWKALHLSIYIAVALNSFITAMAAGNMFQTFKYNCILYCTDISFQREAVTQLQIPSSDQTLDKYPPINETLPENTTMSAINETDTEHQNTIVFKNGTHIFQNEDDSFVVIYAKLDLRKSIFPPNFWCNFVLGVALVTFILSTFFVVILAMCSKGGKGRNNTLNRPQNVVYPILVSSIILGVLNLVGCIVVRDGMRAFCASFELFTEDASCSSLLNKFTIHERQGNFYLPYLVLSHAFNITVILFVGQAFVTLLRVIYAVDYQLYALEVDEDYDEDKAFEIENGQIVKERAL